MNRKRKKQVAAWKRAILHVDMDAFYVNVHILEHPEDAGIPLAVGGKPNQRGVVASASYEARVFGIRSAMPMSRAVELCRQLKIVSINRPQISACSQQVMAILSEYGDTEQVSVDEAYIDLTGNPAPVRTANDIQKRIKRETKLPASVGLASSKLVAKIASDWEKPEGCAIVLPGKEAAFLAQMPIQAIWGIGPKTAERFLELGITTCGHLASADPKLIKTHFGNQAEALQARAQGVDSRQVVAERGPSKSISSEWTFNQDTNDGAELGRRLEKMSLEVGRSLRKQELAAHTIMVKFRLSDFTTYTRQKTVQNPISDTAGILVVAQSIWQEHWQPDKKLRLLGVGVSNLVAPASQQLAFDFANLMPANTR